MTGARRRWVAAGALTLAATVGLTSPALAADGLMQDLQRDETQVRFVLSSTDGSAALDPTSVRVAAVVGDQSTPLDVTGSAPLSESGEATTQVQTTIMLVLDRSGSLGESGLEDSKDAALAFVDGVPEDVSIGLISFESAVHLIQPPTTDHEAVKDGIRGLELGGDTALLKAVNDAIDALPADGVREIVLMTDGKDDADGEGGASADEDATLERVSDSEVKLTPVAVGAETDEQLLAELATNGGSTVISARNTRALTEAFETAAENFGAQLLVAASYPSALAGKLVRVVATATAGRETVTAEQQTTLPGAAPTATPTATATAAGPITIEPNQRLSLFSAPVLLVALLAVFLGLATVTAFTLGAATRSRRPDVQRSRQLSIYTLSGRQPQRARVEAETTSLGDSAFARQAVGVADRIVKGRDIESGLSVRLEAAAVPLRPAEWLLIHVGIAFGATLVMLLLSGGSIAATLLGLILGGIGPWVYLMVRRSRRENAFMARLPDTLQMLAGSLRAGYSLPQALDAVARESEPPISTEFNRALVESRLGVPVEDALEAVATRVGSRDFEWVVMAINIQREVGGNLAELLTTVAATLRERERLRRQVKALSAEGRLSAWILGGLPVVFACYLLLVRPEYIGQLFTSPLGLVMVFAGVGLLLVGAFWLSRVVKVEV